MGPCGPERALWLFFILQATRDLVSPTQVMALWVDSLQACIILLAAGYCSSAVEFTALVVDLCALSMSFIIAAGATMLSVFTVIAAMIAGTWNVFRVIMDNIPFVASRGPDSDKYAAEGF